MSGAVLPDAQALRDVAIKTESMRLLFEHIHKDGGRDVAGQRVTADMAIMAAGALETVCKDLTVLLATPPASDAAVPAGAVDDPDHQYAVVSSNYSRPFLVGAYPTLDAALLAQDGKPDRWHIYYRLAAAPKVASGTGAGLAGNEDGTDNFYRYVRSEREAILVAVERNWNAGPDVLTDAILAALAPNATDGATGSKKPAA